MKSVLSIFTVFFFIINFKVQANTSDKLYEKIDLFGEVLEKVKEEYVDEVDQADVMDSAINGVLQSLDPYSAYMSLNYLKSMQTESKGEFGGLGIEIAMEGGVVKVIAPIADTPAEKVGIRAGDYIVKINEIQVQGKSLMEAVKLMRGPVGSSINLTIRRKGVKKSLSFEITREIIEVKSVESKILGKKDNIGYVKLKSFNENSDKQFIETVKKYEKEKTSWIYYRLKKQSRRLAHTSDKYHDFFLKMEKSSLQKEENSETRKFFAKSGDGVNGKPVIVMINNGSASASEIFAGALKDHKRAIILGESSYGKGSVQSIIPLKNGGG